MAVTLACLPLNHRCFDATSLCASSADSWCLLQDPRPGVHFKKVLSAAVLPSEAEIVFSILFFSEMISALGGLSCSLKVQAEGLEVSPCRCLMGTWVRNA